ncbi:MAG: hypothetical protein WAN87_08005 [Thermoplasmata archaeon]
MTSSSVAPRSLRMAVVVGLCFASFALILGTFLLSTPLPGTLIFLVVIGCFALAYRWNLHRDSGFLVAWVGVSLAVALFSIGSGLGNGLTDEPYFMPAFLRLWPNLYGSSLHLYYYQMGSGEHYSISYFVYLPLLSLIWIPGIDYRWLCVGAWLVMVYAARRTGPSVAILGNPWFALLAANGFNDFVPLLALTLAFVTLHGWKSKVAEVVSLGLKQFANVIVVGYHAWNRQWRDALIAVVATTLFLLPFALLSPGGVWCHAILVQSQPCSGTATGFYSGGAILSHINYVLYPLWIAAIFGPRYVTTLRGAAYATTRQTAVELLARRWHRPENQIPESLVLIVLPFLRAREALARRHRSSGRPPPTVSERFPDRDRPGPRPPPLGGRGKR